MKVDIEKYRKLLQEKDNAIALISDDALLALLDELSAARAVCDAARQLLDNSRAFSLSARMKILYDYVSQYDELEAKHDAG